MGGSSPNKKRKETQMNFNETKLRPEILSSLEAMNFASMTEIQERAVVSGIEGNDILAQAQTGTGKTAAFCLPIIHQIEDNDSLQAIMLAPTRELAVQITTEFKKMAANLPHIKAISVYGGDPIDKQMKLLRERPQVVIGTPGRIQDLINRKKLKLHEIKFFVLDEVDEMLNMGFLDDVVEIEKKMPRTKQTLFFSATMPNRIKTVSGQFLREGYDHIKVDAKSLTVDKVDQYYITCKDSRKYEALKNVLDAKQAKKIIIFTQTKRRADETFDFLISQNFKIEKIHGDLSQQQRLQTINRLRNGDVDIIVATDVVARGIDIDGIDLVINLQLPQDIEYYIHRIGRTGRAGKKGEAITIVSHNEYKRHFQHYPKQLKCTITEMDIPKDDEIIQTQMQREYAKIASVLTDGEIEPIFRDMAYMFDEDDLREVLAIVFQENYPQLSKVKRKKIIKAQFEKTHGGSGRGEGNGRGGNGRGGNGRGGRGNGRRRDDRKRDGRKRDRKSNASNSNSQGASNNYYAAKRKKDKKRKTPQA